MASQIGGITKPDRHRQRQSRLPPKQLALPLDYSPSGHGYRELSERKRTMLGGTRPAKAPMYPRDRLGRNEHGGAMWRRIVDEGVRFGRVNPQLGSEVGRLLFHGQITAVEAAAASQVAEIYARYERSQGLRRTVASPSYVNGCKFACNSDPLRGDFRVQFRPLLTFCVSVLPFGPDGPGRTLGDDWRGQDRPDTARLF